MVKISVMDLIKILAAAEIFNKKFDYHDKKIEEIQEFLRKVDWDSYTEEILMIDELPF